MTIGILWAQFGPYHFARASALQSLAGGPSVCSFELADQSRDYQWNRGEKALRLTTLCPGTVAEQLPFSVVFSRARKEFSRLRIKVCLLPSYAPKQSLAALAAAKSLGIRTVMMNESHAGTARAAGVSALVKNQLVRLFDAALVGGIPHQRYFASLGMPLEKIFTGYDAIDNDYFDRRVNEFRNQGEEVKRRYGLPSRYYLSLGRFVAKKNLAVLLQAYRQFLNANAGSDVHLVMVGSGEEELKLRSLCARLALPVYEKVTAPAQTADASGGRPGVHFYGFRQIDENPVFYAFADAFILPSLREEWGLVVNEAMACGLPVIVSETAGCAEDLLEKGLPVGGAVPTTISRIRQAGLRHKIRRNGFVFNPDASDELSSALGLVSSHPTMRMAMGHHSRWIVKKFSCDNFARNALLAAHAALGEQASHNRLSADDVLATPSA